MKIYQSIYVNISYRILIGKLQLDIQTYLQNINQRMFLHRILLIAIVSTYAMGSQHKTQELVKPFSFVFYLYIFISAFLSCFAGVCSGLTVGYMSISKQEMQFKAQSEDQNQKKIGLAILSVLQNHHLLLSTLLLSNALALEALPIFLDKIVPGYIAVIISTAAVVIFGQVIPQAYCTGPAKVSIGYFFTPFLKGLQCVFYPFVRPITWILDNWIGHHQDKITLTKENLKALLFLHNNRQYGYKSEQIQILQNTLDLRSIDVGSCMIPLNNVFMLNQLRYVDAECIEEIAKCNLSKVPVFSGNRENVVGVIKVKNLLKFNINEPQKIKDGKITSEAVKLNLNDSLLAAIDKLKSKKINFAIVQDQSGMCKGIITLKQIFQKIILKEFKDDDISVPFSWNKPNVLGTIAQGKEQD